jgi:hypothetical protein
LVTFRSSVIQPVVIGPPPGVEDGGESQQPLPFQVQARWLEACGQEPINHQWQKWPLSEAEGAALGGIGPPV